MEMKDKRDEDPGTGNLDRFEQGGDLGAIDGKRKCETRINSLPAGEKELAQETSRFADLCQYFERKHIDIPAEFIDQLGQATCLPVEQRIRAMKGLNQRLMEYLSNVGEDSGFRQ